MSEEEEYFAPPAPLTWAGVLWCLTAISLILGSSSSTGSPGLALLKTKARILMVERHELPYRKLGILCDMTSHKATSTCLIILTLFTSSFASRTQDANAWCCVLKGCDAFLPWAVRRAEGAVRSHSNPFGFTVFNQLFLGEVWMAFKLQEEKHGGWYRGRLFWAPENDILIPLGSQKLWRNYLEYHNKNLSYKEVPPVTAVSRGLAQRIGLPHSTYHTKIVRNGRVKALSVSGIVESRLLGLLQSRIAPSEAQLRISEAWSLLQSPSLSSPQGVSWAPEEAWRYELP